MHIPELVAFLTGWLIPAEIMLEVFPPPEPPFPPILAVCVATLASAQLYVFTRKARRGVIRLFHAPPPIILRIAASSSSPSSPVAPMGTPFLLSVATTT